jgi:hypothetical protein
MFFNTIVGYLKNANEQSSALKYVLFSAHDSTIMSQLSVMGVPPQEIPPYASRLSILLFEVDGRGSVVRVTYNNRPVKIPMCGGVDCPLSIFNRLLS